MSEKISKISVDGVVYDIASTGSGEVPGDIQEQLSALENKVTEEASAREEGDAKLSEKIESEASRVDGMVNQINENVASSIETLNNNLVQAIETINNGIAAEVTNREEGDAKLQAAIDELAEKVNGEGADLTELEGKIEKNAADIATVNNNLVEAVNNINKNVADGFSTINGGLNNEIRPELEKAVKYEDTATEQNPGRKTIFLNNHDNICGKTTDGSAVNIAMVSKWNKVDLGSSSVEINLNGSAERPTYNDSKQIALLEDVHGNMETIALVKKDDLTYELQVGDKIAGTINIPADQFLKSVEYSAEDKSLTFVFNTSEGEQTSVVDLSSLVDTYVAGNGIELIENGFSIKLDPSSESYLSVSEAGIKVEGINEIKKNVQEVAANLVTVNENLASSIDAINKKAVKYEDVADSNLPERKAIVLKNGDVILGGNLEGGTSSLVQLNRWGVADFGSSSVPFNINTPKDVRPTVQEAGQSGEEAHKIAYLSDIVDSSADLEEIKEALSEKADKSDVDAISEKLDSKADKDSVVEYKESGEGRKTIQLANYDSISGIDTKGTGHNLAMVSKWDKADFGAPGLELNLNGSAERPTYNDTEEIALVKDIQVSSSDIEELKAAVEGKADKSELEAVQGEVALKANQADVDFQVNAINDKLAEKADKTELEEAVKYQKFGEDRKTIQLANYDNISGVATDGTSHNLVMLSKWDVADFGAPGVKINLNGSEARPTYNDDKEIALLEDIEAANDKYISYKELESGAKTIELANGDSLSGVNSDGVAGFNLAKVTPENKVEIGSAGMDLNLVGSEPRPLFNGSKGIALSEDLETKAAELQDNINLKASQSDLEAYMSATDTKVSELEEKIGNVPTKVSELENDLGFQNEAQVDGKIKEAIDAIPEVDLEPYATKEELAETTKNAVNYQEFGEGRKTIQLANYDNISGIDTKGVGHNIAMVSKWDKVDLGAPGLEVNLNGSAERPTYNDTEEIALLKDVQGIVIPGKVSEFENDANYQSASQVDARIQEVVASAPEALDTLKELADALGNDPNFAGTVTTELAKKANSIDVYTKEEADAKFITEHQSLEGLATEKFVEEQIAAIPPVDLTPYATKEEIEGQVKYKDIPSEQLPNRKAVELAKGDMLLGGGNNLVQLNRWGIVDLGTPVSPINMNTPKDVRPTVQEAGQLGEEAHKIAYLEDVESVSVALEDKQDKGDYALKSDLEGLATETWVESKGYLTEHQDISGLATKEEVTESSNEVLTNILGRIWTNTDKEESGNFDTSYKHADGSYARIWNETDGGGSQYYNSNKDTLSFVGVNDGNDGIHVQIYSKKKSTNVGARLNATPDGIFYGVGNSASIAPENELVVKKDITEVNTNLEAEIEARSTADTQLQNDLQVEATTAREAEKANADAIVAEVSRATEKEAEIEANLASAVKFTTSTYEGRDKKVITLDNDELINARSNSEDLENKVNVGGKSISLIQLNRWNVVDVGSPYTLTNINTPKGQRPTVQEAGQSGPEANQIAYVSDVAGLSNTLEALNATVQILQSKVDVLTKTNTEVVSVDGSAGELKDSSKDYIVSGSINENAEIVGKSISLKSIKVSDNARLKLNAGDVEAKDLNISGSFPKANGNTVISVNNAEFIVFKDMVFDASEVYNGIEIGLASNSVLPKNILFDNCKFQGEFSNNAILVFGTQDNAIITLNNCYFEKISNALRLSNKSNASGVVVNINNCTVDQWETRAPWQGFLICEDYTNKTEEEVNANNLFGDGKITVNFNNLVHAGVKINPADPASVCGTKNESQVVMVCQDAVAGPEGDYCLSYDAAKFPVVSFK
mgnify:FL=1